MRPPVAISKPLKGKSSAELSEKTMVVYYLVTNQGAFRSLLCHPELVEGSPF